MQKTYEDGVWVEKRHHVVTSYDETDNGRDSIGHNIDFWKV